MIRRVAAIGAAIVIAVLADVASAGPVAALSISWAGTTRHVPAGGGATQVVPDTPHVGELYELGVTILQSGAIQAPYTVRVVMGGVKKDQQVAIGGPGLRKLYFQMKLPLDDVVPWTVELDPDHVSGETESPVSNLFNNHAAGSFKPIPPSVAIDSYSPKLWRFEQRQTLIGLAGVFDDATVLMSPPASVGSQRVYRSSAWSTTLAPAPVTTPIPAMIGNARGDMVHAWHLSAPHSGIAIVEQRHDVELSKVRVNPDLLRQVSWQDLDVAAADPALAPWLQPESVIQSDDWRIAYFVGQSLGFGYRSTMTPYDAARALHRAVIARLEYETPSQAHTAVDTYLKQKGDCGSFSMLIVAAMRNMGIPARVSAGWWKGTGNSHAWSEMYFPGAGWVQSDGSAGDAWSPAGSDAYYFGYVPDLDSRVSNVRGNDFSAFGVDAPWLQTPWYEWNWVSGHQPFPISSTTVKALPRVGPPPKPVNVAIDVPFVPELLRRPRDGGTEIRSDTGR